MRRVYVVLPFTAERFADLARRAITLELGYVGVTVPGELLPEMGEAYADAARKRDEEDRA